MFILRIKGPRSILRMFADKLPATKEELVDKERNALREIQDEDLEREKRKLQVFFPDPSEKLEKKSIPQYPSSFGKSDEEEIEPFFIDDLHDFQYIYTPKDSLSFDQDGYCIIYQSPKQYFFTPLKLKYCWKLIFPILFSIGITVQASTHSTLGILLSWSFPLIMYTKGLIVNSIKLNKDGKTLRISYKRFRFYKAQETQISVESFKEPSGNSFIVWSLYEFPDDLKTFLETESIKRVNFAKYWGNWSFFILPRNAEIINREILVNTLNGIFVDTENLGGEDLKSRYLILHPKVKNK